MAAVFGLKYYAEMRSKYQGISWRCEIAQRGYTGTAEEMASSGTLPILVTWERRGDDFYTPVKASEASIDVMCRDNFHFIGLFTSDPHKFRVSIYRSKLGQLPESSCIEEYNERAQTASVRLEYISDLIKPAIVEINLKRNKVRLIFTRCEDAANLYDFNSRFNDNVKTL